MEHHRILYKDQRSHTPRQHNNQNRKLQEDKRARDRRDRYQISRNMSLSPDRQVKEELNPMCSESKENINEENPDTTRFAKIFCNTTNLDKLTKQEAFIKRFIEWKEAKKNVINPTKKRPFVSCAINSKQTSSSSSLVPIGRHKGFCPPVGLKSSDRMDKVEENKNLVKDKGRQSIYTLVPTPTKKQHPEKSTNLHTKLLDSNKHPNNAMAPVKNASKLTISNNLSNKTPRDLKKGLLRKTPPKSTAKKTVVKVAKTLEKNTLNPTTAQQPLKKELRPRALKMPPPPPAKPVSTAIKQVGAVAKIKTVVKKSAENVKPIKKSPLKSARLAQNFKAKKTLNKKGNLAALKVNGKKIINMIKSNEPDGNMVIQTPRDFATLNLFTEFVTSTKVKEPIQNTKIDNIGSIETSPKKLHSNSSAKRNILAKNNDQNTLKATKEGSPPNAKRFNFIRYSEAKNLTDEGEMINGEGEGLAVTDDDEKTLVEGLDIIDKTSTKFGPEERPNNYLSPFVSVTRGKVSLKKEKEKRNSVYLQNITESDILGSDVGKQNSPKYSVEVKRTLEAVRYFRKQLQNEIDRLHKLCDIWEAYKEENMNKIQNANGEDMINVTIGQTRLLTSKKFMQFKGLIDRCETGATGTGNVEYDGSEDTKPITSVDLEGFWSMLGLQVDNLNKRFENLNLWKANDWVDPEEVNISKKSNLVKVKKPKAAPATKSKPNSALRQMLRKMQAEMRKNKSKIEDTNEIIVLTSSKQNNRRSVSSNNSTPRKSLDAVPSHRLSITVKDRKYFSPVATVISFPSPNRRASLRRKSLPESPKLLKIVQKFNNDLDTLQVSLDLRKSVLTNENSRCNSFNSKLSMIPTKNDSENSQDSIDVNSKQNDVLAEEGRKTQKYLSPQSSYRSPAPSARKSILKTPGTAKSRLRNVIFNEKLRVKKFNFLINDNTENEEANDTHEEDLAKSCEEKTLSNDSPERTLTLRNRKVRLRPSCEIVIPKI